MGRAEVRFYAELADLIDAPSGTVRAGLDMPVPVGRLIESCGVPLSEVDLVLVDGRPVGFDRPVRDGDRLSVYPVFEAFDVGAVTRVRGQPLRTVRFVVDVSREALARYLRLLGFDTRVEDDDPVATSIREHRILLTADEVLLTHPSLTHGMRVRPGDARRRAIDIIARLHLSDHVHPGSRCPGCNGLLEARGGPGWRCGECGRRWDDRLGHPGFAGLVEDALGV